jgi:hypothetical protein
MEEKKSSAQKDHPKKLLNTWYKIMVGTDGAETPKKRPK